MLEREREREREDRSEGEPVAEKTYEPRPLTVAQKQTAAELGWFRRWLLDSGRTEAEIDGRDT